MLLRIEGTIYRSQCFEVHPLRRSRRVQSVQKTGCSAAELPFLRNSSRLRNLPPDCHSLSGRDPEKNREKEDDEDGEEKFEEEIYDTEVDEQDTHIGDEEDDKGDDEEIDDEGDEDEKANYGEGDDEDYEGEEEQCDTKADKQGIDVEGSDLAVERVTGSLEELHIGVDKTPTPVELSTIPAVIKAAHSFA